MRSFEGFQRRAVVIIPEDEEFKNRCEKREKDEGKDVPDTAVWEMKGRTGDPRGIHSLEYSSHCLNYVCIWTLHDGM